QLAVELHPRLGAMLALGGVPDQIGARPAEHEVEQHRDKDGAHAASDEHGAIMRPSRLTVPCHPPQTAASSASNWRRSGGGARLASNPGARAATACLSQGPKASGRWKFSAAASPGSSGAASARSTA